MRRRPRRSTDRAVLALAGTALLAGGLWLATACTRLAARLPAWWPRPAAGSVLLDRGALAGWRAHGWWAPTVIAAGAVTTALLTLWFLSRLTARRRAQLPLSAPGSTLRTRALREAVARRASAVDGVAHCRVRTEVRLRRRRFVRLRLRVWLAPGASPSAIIDSLTTITAEAAHTIAPHHLHSHLKLSSSHALTSPRTPRTH